MEWGPRTFRTATVQQHNALNILSTFASSGSAAFYAALIDVADTAVLLELAELGNRGTKFLFQSVY